MGHGETLIGKHIGNVAQALRNPPQRTLGVSQDGRLHERIKRLLKAVLNLDRRLAAPARTANTARRGRLLSEFRKTTVNGRPRNPRRPRDQGHAAMAKGQGLGRNKQSEALFIKMRRQGLEPSPDVLDRIHAASESYFDSKGNPSATKRFACFATSP